MLSRQRSALALLSALALIACGGSAHFDGDGAGARGAGGGSGGGGGGIGGGSGGSCQSYFDEDPGQAVSVTIKNGTSELIYLSGDGCRATIELGLENPAGEPRQFDRDPCGTTCENLQGEAFGCTADCAMPPVILVKPGGSYTRAWSGTFFEPKEMPLSCFHSSQGTPADGTCSQQIVAPAGEYTLIASAWSSLLNCDNTKCTCQPDASGSCKIEGFGQVNGVPAKASSTVNYPSATSMVIEFK